MTPALPPSYECNHCATDCGPDDTVPCTQCGMVGDNEVTINRARCTCLSCEDDRDRDAEWVRRLAAKDADNERQRRAARALLRRVAARKGSPWYATKQAKRRRKQVTVTLSDEARARLHWLSEHREQTQSELIEEWILGAEDDSAEEK